MAEEPNQPRLELVHQGTLETVILEYRLLCLESWSYIKLEQDAVPVQEMLGEHFAPADTTHAQKHKLN